MSYQNISATLSQTDIDAVNAAVQTIESKLPFLVTLSPKERKALHKMGEKSVSYVQQCLQVAKSNPTILPRDFDVAEFERDVNLATSLLAILTPIQQLCEELDDTLMAVGSEAITESSVVYAQAKLAAKRTPGMKTVAEQLGQRYKRMKAKAAPLAASPQKQP
jgi:septation ring formation regulator EzrA